MNQWLIFQLLIRINSFSLVCFDYSTIISSVKSQPRCGPLFA